MPPRHPERLWAMVGKDLPALESEAFSIFLSRHCHPRHPERLWAMVDEGLPALVSKVF